MTRLCLHFGVDDVFESLFPVECSAKPSRHAVLSALARLHEESGYPLHAYVFLAGEVAGHRSELEQVPSTTRALLATMPWLRLGPHGLDEATPPYCTDLEAQRQVFAAIYAEIDQLVGYARRAHNVRLHHFSESFALADWWRSQGVDALLTTDRPVVAHHLDEPTRAMLAATGTAIVNGMRAYRTHERVEDLARLGLDERGLVERLDHHLNRHGRLVLCSHEDSLAEPEVLATAVRCLRHARARGCVDL